MAKNVLMVIAQKDFRDEELLVPRETFEKAGAQVTVAAPSTDVARGMLRATVTPDLALAAANAGDYDAVIFVGGSGAQSLFDDEAAHKLARDTVTAGKLLGAICLGPGILARAGVLKGKTATVFPSDADALRQAGAYYVKDHVALGDKLVTADGPEAASAFADAVVAELKR